MGGKDVKPMITSAKLQERILNYLSDGAPHSIQEIKASLEQAGITDYTDGQFSGSINTLVRNQTIDKVDRAVYAISKGGQHFMKYCFVVSPIGDEGSQTRDHADKLLKHIITPVCQACGFEVERVDQMNDFNSITQTIIEKLQSADLVIADISEHNPNVFYEMGYRKCTGKPIIHLKRKNENERIPFDVNTIRTFEYDLADLDSVADIKERLQQAILAFSFEEVQEIRETDRGQNKSLGNVMPMLYQILDSITELKEEISRKDMETIQAIMQTSLNNAAKEESQETIIMKTILPELMRNPETFINLQKLAQIANKNKT